VNFSGPPKVGACSYKFASNEEHCDNKLISRANSQQGGFSPLLLSSFNGMLFEHFRFLAAQWRGSLSSCEPGKLVSCFLQAQLNEKLVVAWWLTNGSSIPLPHEFKGAACSFLFRVV